MTDWNQRTFRGTWNRYPYTEIVSFVMRRFGGAADRSAVSVLDLGCGGGNHMLFLAAEGFDYQGIDGSREAVDRANQRLRDAGHDDKRAITGTFDALPYPDNRFDGVIDRGSLTFNPGADLPGLLAEVRRVLKPGGVVFSMLMDRAIAAGSGGRSLGGGDYDNLANDLAGAKFGHFTDTDEARRLFGGFSQVSIERIVRTREHPQLEDPVVEAWTVVTATK